jgi:uncharacterized membrane protein
MDDFVRQVTDYVELSLNAVAVLVIAFGTIEAVIAIVRAVVSKDTTGGMLRDAFIRFARWLIAALTFQLGADIVGTLIAPSWDDLGKLAAIAVIRTFLTYFLDRDLDKILERQRAYLEREGGDKPHQVSLHR